MNLHQQIIADRIENAQDQLTETGDKAFLHLVYSLVSGSSLRDLDSSDITDGGQDKQIDAIVIDQEGDAANVFVIQATITPSFSSNKLIQMKNGLRWLFLSPRSEYTTISNTSFKDKISEYRSVQRGLGPSNIKVNVIFATTADSVDISQEFLQEKNAIQSTFDTGAFSDFSVQILGATELVNLLNREERRTRRVDADLKIIYDTNNPSLIRYYASDLKGLVCSIPAREIASLVQRDEDGAIFDLNVRRFLGDKGVNKEIRATCSSTETSYLFWFLNNGITIVCSSFDTVTDPDNPHVKIRNLQIVNGCQTASTLASSLESGELPPDARVIVRVYETEEKNMVDRIVLSTNNQTKITNRDLRANDSIQQDIQRAFEIYNYYFERKPKEYDNSAIDLNRVISNEFAAQSVLAVILRRPSDARRRKYKVWSEYYDHIFKQRPVQHFIIAPLIAKACKDWMIDQDLPNSTNENRRKLAKNCQLHLARIVAFKWKNSDTWNISTEEQDELLNQLDQNPTHLYTTIADSFDLLSNIISDPLFVNDIDAALKSYTLDTEISRRLNTNNAEQLHSADGGNAGGAEAAT